MGTFNNNSTWGKVLNIVITILTAIATTFGTASCMWQTERWKRKTFQTERWKRNRRRKREQKQNLFWLCRATRRKRPQSGIKSENYHTPSPLRGTTPILGVESKWKAQPPNLSPEVRGRMRSLEKWLNVISYLMRWALPSAMLDPKGAKRRGYVHNS